MTIGNEFREARERLGRTREQISSATKIQLHKIAALEDGAFERLPTGIYLDGIAAAYAREVGLDAEAVVRRLRAEVVPPPPGTLEEIVAVRQAREQRARELQFSHVHGMLAFAAIAVVLMVLGTVVHLYPSLSMTEPAQSVAVDEMASLPIPFVAPRFSDTAVPQPTGTTGVEPVEPPAEPQPVAEPITAQEPVIVPERLAEPTPVQKSVVAPQPVAPPAPSEDPDPVVVPQRVSAPEPFVDAVDVSFVAGSWAVETTVESSSLRTFEGLRLGYHLELRQEGGRIEGTGRKVSENGVSLKGGRRTPIAVHGTINQGRVQLQFGERGARRPSNGTFDLVLEDPGVLRGHFSSDAARSAGVVKARRL